jgi:hypothetical protein
MTRYPYNTLLALGNEEYHAAPGMGSTALRDFVTSPLLYGERYVYKSLPPDDSAALRLGSVVDSIILEPTALDSLVELIPTEVLNKDGHRKGSAWSEWSSCRADKLLVKRDEWDDIRRMVDCVWACPPAVDLLAATMHQQAVFWEDMSGWIGKCKFDGVCSEGFFDLKTTAEPLPDFRRSIYKYKYLLQMAWYSIGYSAAFEQWPQNAHWIVVSKQKPYECMVVVVPEIEEWAHDTVRRVVDKIKVHHEQLDWSNPKYLAPVVYDLDLPNYGEY